MQFTDQQLREQAAIDAARNALQSGVRDWRLASTEAYLTTLENLAMFTPKPLEAPFEFNLASARKRLAARARYLASQNVLTIHEIKFAPSDEAAGFVATGGETASDSACGASVKVWRRVLLPNATPELLTLKDAICKFKDESPAAELSPSVAKYIETRLRNGEPCENWYARYEAYQPEQPRVEPILS